MFSFCMYCFSTRCASITIAITSIIFILTGAASIYLVTRLQDSSLWQLQEYPNTDNENEQSQLTSYKNVAYYGLLTLTSCSVALGFFGLITARCKNCCTIGCFSFLTLLFWVIFIAMGVLLGIVTAAGSQLVGQYCNNQNYDKFTVNAGRYFVNAVEDFDKASQAMVDKYMCSFACPCVQVDRNLWGGRAGQLANSTYYFSGQYSTFYQCYTDLVKDQKIQPLSNEMLGLIKDMEDRFDCLGMCQTPLFGFFKDVRTGPPAANCQSGTQRLLMESFGVLAIGLLVTGLFIFIAFNAQYGLWRKRFGSKRRSEQTKQGSGQDRRKNYKIDEE